MISKKTYEAYQAMAHLLLKRDYKPNEFQLFAAATEYIGPKMKEFELHEKNKDSDSAGAKNKNKRSKAK